MGRGGAKPPLLTSEVLIKFSMMFMQQYSSYILILTALSESSDKSLSGTDNSNISFLASLDVATTKSARKVFQIINILK